VLGYRRSWKSGDQNIDLINPNSTRRQAGELNVRRLIESGSGIPYAIQGNYLLDAQAVLSFERTWQI
jgi:hypothetical protein